MRGVPKGGHDVSCPCKDETLAAAGRRKLFDPLTAQENVEISGSVDEAEDLDSLRVRAIEDEDSFEAGEPENSQGGEFRVRLDR